MLVRGGLLGVFSVLEVRCIKYLKKESDYFLNVVGCRVRWGIGFDKIEGGSGFEKNVLVEWCD